MLEWEHWEDWSSSSSTESLFPVLRKLIVSYCPKLIKNLPTYLPDLTKLHVGNCPKLEFQLLRLPSLKEVNIRECNEGILRSGIALTSLTNLTIDKIFGITKLHEGFVQSLRGLQTLEIQPSEEIKCLWDDEDDNDNDDDDDDDDHDDGFGWENDHPCPEIRHFHRLVSLGLGCNLRSLKISRCALKRLANEWQKSLTCLEELEVIYCPKLVSFPEVGFPPNLRRLTLNHCEGLRCLPDGMMLNTSNDSSNFCLLESLEIRFCSSLICFPKGQLPTTLKTLSILDCQNIKSLPEGMMHRNFIPNDNTKGTGMCALEDLLIRKCPSLTGFPEGSIPTSLKKFEVAHCGILESLPEGIMDQYSNNTTTNGALQVLAIHGCPSLTSFPRGKFPSTLEVLQIQDCEQLESISEEMFHSSSTHYLSTPSAISINHCKNLKLRPHQFQYFTRLTSLRICHCQNINTPLSQWGLIRLSSLKNLSIGGMFSDSSSFSDDPHLILLPITLTSLSLDDFQNLESLASLSLQTLTSLAYLWIHHCPMLRSIFPRGQLFPDTLSQLFIIGCPLLSRRFSKEKGDDWVKIAHIPYVKIRD